MNNRIIIAVLATMASLSGYAQGGSKSPYSQYGLGTIADQSQGFSRGMNGVGLALRKGNVVNTLNPASYSSIDSLTMVFDVGMSGQSTNFKENNTSLNVKNANFEYAVGSFRLFKNVGASFGVLPYSNIGYDYSSTTKLENNFGTVTETYSGSGGMHQAFIRDGAVVGWCQRVLFLGHLQPLGSNKQQQLKYQHHHQELLCQRQQLSADIRCPVATAAVASRCPDNRCHGRRRPQTGC